MHTLFVCTSLLLGFFHPGLEGTQVQAWICQVFKLTLIIMTLYFQIKTHPMLLVFDTLYPVYEQALAALACVNLQGSVVTEPVVCIQRHVKKNHLVPVLCGV